MSPRTLSASLLCSFVLGLGACMPVPDPSPTTKKPKSTSGSPTAPSTAGAGGASGCGPVSQRGVCQVIGTTPSIAQVCSSNQLVSDDCGSRGLVCTVDATRGAICVTPPKAGTGTGTSTGTGTGGKTTGSGVSASPNTTCGTTPSTGTCTGSVMKWCGSNQKLFTTDCAYDAGFTCKMQNGEARCVDQSGSAGTTTTPTATPCGTTPATGICSGSVMYWCSNNQKLNSDCAYDAGFTCQMVAGEARCVDTTAPATDPCGGITAQGMCEGTVMKWCLGQYVDYSDCAWDAGYTCEMIGGAATCVSTSTPGSPTASGCAGVSADGVCDGNILRWCSGTSITAIDCGVDPGYTCQQSSTGATCAP